MLDPSNIIRLLLDQGLITASRIVDGDLSVVDCSRRNRNFRIVGAGGPGYLVKQAADESKRRTLRHEAGIYAQAAARAPSKLTRLLPRLHWTDENDGLLVLEYRRDSQNLREFHQRRGRFPRSLAAALGRATAAIHHTALAGLPDAPPHGLSLHRPDLAIFQHASQGCLDLLRVVGRSSTLMDGLDALREHWSATAFIHADLRWDNCVVIPARGRRRFQIVDWELARRGDPAWDVGTVFAGHLAFWVESAPWSEHTPPEMFMRFARHPLERMWPALGAFWNAYARRALPAGAESRTAFFARSMRCAAGRLVQTAFESVQNATTITPQAVLLLQLSENIFARPEEAGPRLLNVSAA